MEETIRIEHSEVSARLEILARQFIELADQLNITAQNMEAQGEPPAPALADRVVGVRREFDALVAQVSELGRTTGTETTHPFDSLDHIRRALAAVADAQSQRANLDKEREQAIGILERVAHLAHISGELFPSLQNCQNNASELKLTLLQANDLRHNTALTELAQGTHPFAALLHFIEHRYEIEDDEWTRYEQRLTEAFGKPLVLAIIRDKVVLKEHGDTFVEPSDLEESLPSEPTPAAEDLVTRHLPAPEESSIQDLSESSLTGALQSTVAESEPGAPPHLPAGPHVPIFPLVPTPPLVEIAPEALIPSPRTLTSHLWMYAPDVTAQVIARAALQAEPNRDLKLRDLIWRLISENRFGLAMQIARALQALYPDLKPTLPVWLIRVAGLGAYVRHDAGEISHWIRNDLANYDLDQVLNRKDDWETAVHLLIAGATLQPALLASTTGAAAVLRSLRKHEGLSRFYDYCQEIASCGEKLQGLDVNGLMQLKSHASWQAGEEQLYQDTQAWFEQANTMTMTFAPATKVWRKWLDPGQYIHSLLTPILEKDARKIPAARAVAERLASNADIKREVDFTDRNVLKRRGENITASALAQIRRHTREAIGFFEQWDRHHQLNIARDRGYLQEQAEHLRQIVQSNHPLVLAELQTRLPNAPLPVQSAITVCFDGLERINRLFLATPASFELTVESKYLLNAELLKAPHIKLDEQWELEVLDWGKTLPRLLTYVSQEQPNWATAFDWRAEERDHTITNQIIEYLRVNPEPGTNPAALEQLRAKRIQECQTALRNDIIETGKQIETAVTFGLLREEERVEFAAETQNLERQIGVTLNFRAQHLHLESIRAKIEKKRAAGIELIRQRLDAITPAPTNQSRQRVIQSLERGDLLTANEYIDMLSQHTELPASTKQTIPFTLFFPNTLQSIEDWLEGRNALTRPDLAAVTENIRRFARRELEHFSIGPISLRGTGGTHALQAAEMLEAWLTLKRTMKPMPAELDKVLRGLGFNPIEIQAQRSSTRNWVEITAELIRDRNRCPIPAYGSDAEGHYRVLFIGTRPMEEDLINDVGETARARPTIVMHFGRLTAQRRRDLARLCRERRRTFIVIDDALILYLCGAHGSRMPVLFSCTLPFTYSEPYTSTAGVVPPEMFYGRQQERRSIINPMGSCFIYGGRQLGKTALLREIERNYHAPAENRLVIWIDLKVEGIGYDRNPDTLWLLLMQELKKYTVVPENLPSNVASDKFLQHIQSWLDEDKRRSILFLLDEADRFLESDGKEEFVRTARIKGLMDRTGRRFKVVFAGLHNVQRTTRQENNPLAHYGDPIRIGPLLDNGEWREARALIEDPFRAIGFQFQDPDLVTRILSQTNYYPSLIQLYCKQLLTHVTASHRTNFDPRTGPPYIITSKHVEDAYQDQALRDAIRSRFMLTLDLDPRYRVIAFAIALYSISEESTGVDGEFSVSRIRNDALTWWADGFKEKSSEEMFRSLLDEMVGLGVLRKTFNDTYALRSPNVISLIGTKPEIESELQSQSNREAPPEYEPASYRMALRNNTGKNDPRRSPLTSEQEAHLHQSQNGVSIICGTEAAGLRDLKAFLSASFGVPFFDCVDAPGDQTAFTNRLNGLSARSQDGTTLLFVSHTALWKKEWVALAYERLSRLTSKKSFVRIAFVADPFFTWRLVEEPTDEWKTQVSCFNLHPWNDIAVRQWLIDYGFPDNREHRLKLSQVTGNWPYLLQKFYDLAQRNPEQWQNDITRLNELIHEPGFAVEFAAALGLDLQTPRGKILRDLAQIGEASVDDLTAIVENMAPEVIRQTLRWAERLSLIQFIGNEQWRVQPQVGVMLHQLKDL